MTDLVRAAKRALSLMDLTSLNDGDTEQSIIELCRSASSPVGKVAAVCVYPRFIPVAKKTLKDLGCADILVATVTNFPVGEADVALALEETRDAVSLGADEVDVVFPYRALMTGYEEVGARLVAACKQACASSATLKVIIESGELASAELIRRASQIAIESGADFIKTSTGKVAVNATLEAAQIMLQAIRDSGRDCGFKAAGGVRTTEEAAQYLALADNIMGEDWVGAQHFRFGASSLLQDLLSTLGASSGLPKPGAY